MTFLIIHSTELHIDFKSNFPSFLTAEGRCVVDGWETGEGAGKSL